MKIKLTLFLIILSFGLFAQNKGMNYQAIILDPNPIEVPGANLEDQPLASQNICIKFNFTNAKGLIEYSESQQTVSDEFGLINVIIGNGSNKSSINAGIFSSFSQLNWDENQKTLAVFVSLDDCRTYKLVSSQPLSYTPYALYADAVEFKNVRDYPTKISFYVNDMGYIIPKDLDPMKLNITHNALLIDQNQKDHIASDLVINQTLTKLDAMLDDHAGQLDDMGNQFDEMEAKVVEQNIRINTNQTTVLGQIVEVNAKISNMKSTVDLMDQSTEKLSSKSNAIDMGASNPSSQLYPTQKATKSYVDNSIVAAVGSGVPDATTLAVGKVQLAGDLSGTARNPTVPALQNKEDLSNKSINIQFDANSYSKYPSVKAVKDYVDQATLGIALQANLEAKADKNSPTFTGTPVLPTGTTGVTQGAADNSLKLATTAFVQLATNGIALQASVDAKADKNSPTFTGTPVLPTGTTGVTQGAADNSLKLATTAFVQLATNGIALQASVDAKADKNSPTFTGTPVLPTGTTGVTQGAVDNSLKLATTAFVQLATTGIALQAAVDLKADKNSPTFSGIPILPTGTLAVTQTTSDSSLKLATTAFVKMATAGIALQSALDTKADKNSPTFTGNPVLPTGTTGVTQGAADNSTKMATTAFVQLATAGIALQANVDSKADKNSPIFTGIPVMPTGTIGVTQMPTDSSLKLATTAFIKQAAAGVFSQINIDSKADKNSPIFTGIPVMPTGTLGVTQMPTDSSLKLATTAFIKQTAAGLASQININSKADKNSPIFTGIPVLPTGTIGVTQMPKDSSLKLATTAFIKQTASGLASQININSKADKNSPIFTGIPVMPTGTIGVTQSVADSSLKLATTAFIKQITSGAASQVNVNTKANMVSPIFTGIPSLPTGTIAVTQAVGNNSTAIATTAFVLANSNASGYQSITTGNEISTSSPTDIPVNGMTITALAGKYIVSFNSQYTLEAANVTGQASVDLTKAYIYLMTKPVTIFGHGVLYGAAGAGEILGPGIYSNVAAVTTAGILTLDGGGNPNAEFVFNFGAAFSTGASFELVLKNGASACNVYWVVEGAIAMGANTSMKGFFISNNGAIALGSNSTVDGSIYSKLGAIDILSSTITRSIGCVNNFGALNNFAIYSKVGAISNTGNSKITGNIGYDGLNASLVTGFDSAIVYGEIFTAGISSAIANFSLYQNGNQIPFSARKRVSKSNVGEINLQAIATVGSGENIDVRWNVDTGTIKLQNRILTILSVRD